jgi:hypothetical protein
MYLIQFLRHLARDRGGVAMLEFAFALPLVVPIGLYSIELANYALTQMKVSQFALTLADNASRVGADTALQTQELREVDVNDVLQGVRLQGRGIGITEKGRITLSSIETTSTGGQYIHWQRCLGLKSGTNWDSSYGHENDGSAPSDTFSGMGLPGSKVVAPTGSGVIFVEINYDYQPLISNYFLGEKRLHFIASYLVRDKRDFAKGVTNPAPAAPIMSCDKHTI